MKSSLLFLLVFSSFCCFSQNDVNFYGTKYSNPIVDTLPKYPGGKNELMDYISLNFRVNQSMQNQVGSRVHEVIFTFIVDTSGNALSLQVQNCPSSFVEKEFRRIFSTMHNWVPAIHNGRQRSVQVDLGFDFLMTENQLMYMPNNGPVISPGRKRGKRPAIKVAMITMAISIPIIAIIMSEKP